MDMYLTPATGGGIMLIIGAFLMYRGLAIEAILVYFIADTMWAWMSWEKGDLIGFTLVIIGMTLGFGVFLKMHTGLFVKNLRKDNNDFT